MNLFRIIAVAMLLLAGLSLANPPSAFAVPVRKPTWEAEAPPNSGVAWSTRRIAFEMNGKPWDAVLEWFADQAGMSCNGLSPPPGTFIFIGPKSRQYTLTEIYDIINERLQADHRSMLLRGETALMVVSADNDKGYLIPRVALNELKNRGRTELVEVVVSLPAGFDMDEFVPNTKRLLGPFAHVTSLGNGQVILRANVATLLRMLVKVPR